MKAQECAHEAVEWFPDPTDEAGWRCADCRANLGYRPDLDRSHVNEKAMALLMDLQVCDLVYVSNNEEGEIIAAQAAEACRRKDRYDHYTVLRALLDAPDMGVDEHAEYWAEKAATR